MKRLLLLLFCCSTAVYSQSNILSSGNDIVEPTGKVNYSVGLLNFKEATGSGGTSSTGSQLAFEVSTLSTKDIDNIVSIEVFPNPTSDFIYINLKQNESLKYSLVNISGKELKKGEISKLKTKIDLSKFNTSIYILSMYRDNKLFKSYKILKK
ncbi:T9SS type A sorting domain-containing protein [uncultured Lacinutrix sp.]|uniref:T9SS type A sorting domain-containing protein n=1 Tax=uncultured Lacinutrix sp. TaxID=574032 RepID=UPI0026398615|nr:T9SS type A sorting domain-containing protein [uncultured Lacinutrix sp.]